MVFCLTQNAQDGRVLHRMLSFDLTIDDVGLQTLERGGAENQGRIENRRLQLAARIGDVITDRTIEVVGRDVGDAGPDGFVVVDQGHHRTDGIAGVVHVMADDQSSFIIDGIAIAVGLRRGGGTRFDQIVHQIDFNVGDVGTDRLVEIGSHGVGVQILPMIDLGDAGGGVILQAEMRNEDLTVQRPIQLKSTDGQTTLHRIDQIGQRSIIFQRSGQDLAVGGRSERRMNQGHADFEQLAVAAERNDMRDLEESLDQGVRRELVVESETDIATDFDDAADVPLTTTGLVIGILRMVISLAIDVDRPGLAGMLVGDDDDIADFTGAIFVHGRIKSLGLAGVRGHDMGADIQHRLDDGDEILGLDAALDQLTAGLAGDRSHVQLRNVLVLRHLRDQRPGFDLLAHAVPVDEGGCGLRNKSTNHGSRSQSVSSQRGNIKVHLFNSQF